MFGVERASAIEVSEGGGSWGRRDEAWWAGRREAVADQFSFMRSDKGQVPLRYGAELFWSEAVGVVYPALAGSGGRTPGRHG